MWPSHAGAFSHGGVDYLRLNREEFAVMGDAPELVPAAETSFHTELSA